MEYEDFYAFVVSLPTNVPTLIGPFATRDEAHEFALNRGFSVYAVDMLLRPKPTTVML